MKIIVALMLVAIPTAGVHAGEVAYFRHDGGVAGDDDATYPEQLDPAANLLWRVPLAKGHSTPCVHGDAIFLTTVENDVLATVALDRASGQTRWRQICPAKTIEAFHATGSPAVATVACDGPRVFAFFGSFGLLCYDRTGTLLWSKPLGPFQDEFGAGSSPILVDGKLILNEDHDLNSYLIAVDAATGKTLWQTPRENATRSYATPVVWQSPSGKQLIVAGALRLSAYDVTDGRLGWTIDGLARIVNTTPASDGKLLYVATWSPGGDPEARIAMDAWPDARAQWDKDKDGKLRREEVNNPEVLDRFYRIDLNQDQGLDEAEWTKYARVFELARNSMVAVRPGGTGDITSKAIVWEHTKNLPYVPSPLVYRGLVFLVKNGGIATTLDAATGKLIKQGRLPGTSDYYASPVAASGKVYFASEKGTLCVVSAEGAWRVLHSHDLAERTVATPVLSGGRVFVRTEAALYCFGPR